jgi:hypothetical protein
VSETSIPEGKRRPKAEDLQPLIELVETMSLRKACAKLGLHRQSTDAWLKSDPERSGQYERAREERAESLQEESLEVTKAAALGTEFDGKKVDAAGARVYLDAIKWAKGQMAPKTTAPTKFDVAITDLPGDARRARIAELVGRLGDQEPDAALGG